MIGLPSPVTVYVAIGALVIGAYGGYKYEYNVCQAAYAKALEQAAQQKQQMQETLNAKSAAYEEASDRAAAAGEQTNTTIKEIYRSVPAPPANCAVPDALRVLLNERVGSANAAATSGKSGASVPSTSAGTQPAN